MNTIRLLPIMMLAAMGLLGLKGLGIMFSGSYALSGVAPAAAQSASKREKTPLPNKMPKGRRSLTKSDDPVEPVNDEPEEDNVRVIKGADGTVIRDEANSVTVGSRSRQAVIERLSERRTRLDKREKELELREQLLAATEKRLEARVAELKAIEQQIQTAATEKKKKQEEKLMRLVKMYESMKSKDAARIFDRLDQDVLVKVVKLIRPRKMAPILGRMTPEAAERLTIALAAGDQKRPEPDAMHKLPKIESNSTN